MLNSFGLFFSGTSGTVVVVGVKRLFAFVGWRSSLQPQWSAAEWGLLTGKIYFKGVRELLNQVAMCYSALALQKVWQKKTTEEWAWGVLQKDSKACNVSFYKWWSINIVCCNKFNSKIPAGRKKPLCQMIIDTVFSLRFLLVDIATRHQIDPI